jgi:hypothetical protein
MVEASKQTKI